MKSRLESTSISTLPEIAPLALGDEQNKSMTYGRAHAEELAQVAGRDPRRSADAGALVRRDAPTAMTQAFLAAPTPPPNEAPKMVMRGLLLMAHEDSPVTGDTPLEWTAVYMRLSCARGPIDDAARLSPFFISFVAP